MKNTRGTPSDSRVTHASNVFSFWQLSSIKLTFHVIFLLQLLPGIPERRRPFHCLSNFLTGSTALIIAPAETLETYCITSCSQRAPKLHKSPTCFTGNNLKWYFISAVFKKSSVTTFGDPEKAYLFNTYLL